ncbi:hypothetical protein [Nitrospirillum sp. BR 11163]|uniref:hypothetical protein n=1 Tax=Nitrospirillum sp. BR 11163 TaxID=3104323 RepID=UPI002AFEB69D|nr:hypothetical protein [Nitrospirillum sp. BR 11163]MEA1677012.1 hypothetical protein [Nitrospirillum sp. BR 11163]
MSSILVTALLAMEPMGMALAQDAGGQDTPGKDTTKDPAAPPDTAAAETKAADAPATTDAQTARKPARKRCATTGSRLGGDCQAGTQADPRQVLENRTNPSGMPPH